MRVTISQTENGGLKNNFKISYGGINFSADENFPVEFSEDGISHKAKLISFEESERSLTLNFENEIALIFSLDEKSDSESEEKSKAKNENSTFWIRAKMPENVLFVCSFNKMSPYQGMRKVRFARYAFCSTSRKKASG